MQRACDVAVIGAGLSGLRAAEVLVQHGVDVVVLEAQGRVGGRTLTEHLGDGTFIDHGGQWVSPGRRGSLGRRGDFCALERQDGRRLAVR